MAFDKRRIKMQINYFKRSCQFYEIIQFLPFRPLFCLDFVLVPMGSSSA